MSKIDELYKLSKEKLGNKLDLFLQQKADGIDFYIDRNILNDYFPIGNMYKFNKEISIYDINKYVIYRSIYYIIEVSNKISSNINNNYMLFLYFEYDEGYIIPHLYFSLDGDLIKDKDWFHHIGIYNTEGEKIVKTLVENEGLSNYINIYGFYNIYTKNPEVSVFIELNERLSNKNVLISEIIKNI